MTLNCYSSQLLLASSQFLEGLFQCQLIWVKNELLFLIRDKPLGIVQFLPIPDRFDVGDSSDEACSDSSSDLLCSDVTIEVTSKAVSPSSTSVFGGFSA